MNPNIFTSVPIMNPSFLFTLSNILLAKTFQNVEKTGHLCQKQFKALNGSTLFQMFDASAKTMNGLLYQNMYQLGNFDECYDIVNGKYCLGSLGTRTKRLNLGQLHFGICVPSGCTSKDLEALIPIAHFSDDLCYSKDTEPVLTVAAVVTLAILGIFIGIVIVATVCDLMMEVPSTIVLAFSALSNGRKLFKTSTNQDQLLCLNGIKAISMMWVILGHVYINSSEGPLGDFVDIRKWQENIADMVIVNATVSVDSFFTIGGLVTVYTFLKSMEKGVKFNIFQYYLHRYLRLTPSLAIVVLIHATVLQYLGNGPLWDTINEHFATPCQNYWWSALLYVQNYFHGSGTCVPQSWYLSVDFQLFFLSPVILVPLQRHPTISMTVLGILVPLSCIIPFVIGYVYKIPAFINDIGTKPDEMMWRYYKQTYARFGPYVVGMITGYLIYSMKKKVIVLNYGVVLLVWFLSLGGLAACIFAPYSASLSYDVWSHSLILAFMRNAWAVGLSGVIFICVSGYGGVVDKFLSLPIFQFLTKLSYAMYLVHYSIITMRYASMRHVFFLSNEHMLWSFWGDFMFTLFFSLLLTLMFESPILTLEKSIFGSRLQSSSNKKLDV